MLDRGNGVYHGEAQVVIRDQGVVNYFKQKMGWLYINHDGHYVEKINHPVQDVEFDGRIDFSQKYESSGSEMKIPSVVIGRRGDGLLVELVRVSVWYSGGFYDETTGTWRGGSPAKHVEKIADWYFEDCSR